MHTHMCYMSTHTCIYTFIHMYIHISIYTHTNSHTHRSIMRDLTLKGLTEVTLPRKFL